MGYRVSALGDVTGDGLAEYLAVGLFDSATYNLGGRVYLVSGATGGSLDGANSLVAGGDEWFLGASVDGGPDLTGDAIPDLVVGADGFDNRRGHTWLISGEALATATSLDPQTSNIGSISGEEEYSYSGHATAFLGDLWGDGTEWVGITAPYATAGSAEAGRVAGFEGVTGSLMFSDGDLQVAGYYGGGRLGTTISRAGDEDGDGLDDYMVSLDSGDIAAILPGGLAAPRLPDDAIFRLTRSPAGEADREEPFMIGDVDGDGHQDLAAIHNTTAVRIFTDLATNPVQVVEDATSSVSYGTDSYGFSLADIGDLDADGRHETLLALTNYGSLALSLAVVWPGASVTYGSEASIEDAPLHALSNAGGDGYGYRVAVSGDVDGDGARDIILGAPSSSDGASSGGAIITIPVPR